MNQTRNIFLSAVASALLFGCAVLLLPSSILSVSTSRQSLSNSREEYANKHEVKLFQRQVALWNKDKWFPGLCSRLRNVTAGDWETEIAPNNTTVWTPPVCIGDPTEDGCSCRRSEWECSDHFQEARFCSGVWNGVCAVNMEGNPTCILDIPANCVAGCTNHTDCPNEDDECVWLGRTAENECSTVLNCHTSGGEGGVCVPTSRSVLRILS